MCYKYLSADRYDASCQASDTPPPADTLESSAGVRLEGERQQPCVTLQRHFRVLTKFAHVDRGFPVASYKGKWCSTHPQTFVIEDHVLQVSL